MSRRRRIWLLAISAGTLLGLVVLAAGVTLVLATWHPAEFVNHVERVATPSADDERALAEWFESISRGLGSRRGATGRVSIDRVSRWLNVPDDRLPGVRKPAWLSQSPPPLLRGAGSGILRAFIGVSRGGFDLAVTIDVRFIMPEDPNSEYFWVELVRVRCGRLTIPRSWVLSQVVPDDETIRGVKDGRIKVQRYGWWPNGELPFTLQSLSIEEDEIVFSISPP